MTEPSPQEKIYLTAKTRMVAESKILTKAKIVNALLGWYSFCLIVLSICDLTEIIVIANFGVVSLIISIGLLCFTLASNSPQSYERAAKFRRCYLLLEELYNSSKNIERKMSEYAKIKLEYENHSNLDYEDMLFEAKFHGKELTDSNGILEISWAIVAKVVARKALNYLIIGFGFAAPFLSVYFVKLTAA
jgi:SMODS and SLOG-associating 2TM effector domain family 5